MKKVVYLAVYGQNQVPFTSKKSMLDYFSNAGNLFESVLNDVKFYKLIISPIDSPLKTNEK